LDTLAALAEFYPVAFGLPRKPLKIGVHLDLIERAPVTPPETREALRRYCCWFSYLGAMVAGADRIDLDDIVCGTVTASEAEHAKLKLDEALRKLRGGGTQRGLS
jgi:ProP effector